MTSALDSAAVRSVIAEITRDAQVHEAAGKALVAEARRAGPITPAQRAALLRDAPMPVSPDVGRLLYLLAGARGRVVEFGASLGVSTIHLAAGLRDLGGGELITTEIDPVKVARLQTNLAAAGLAERVEVRCGDARETLRGVTAVDLLVLDGFNELYLPMLALLAPQLTPGALVAADLSSGDPDHAEYQAFVRDPANGFVSVTLPLGAGVELSTRVG